jgi:transcriptional regulator with XRE-family HTH domain
MSTLADRLRAAMAAYDSEPEVTQAELARACGVKPPSVNGWLNGKSKFLRGENLLKAARALKVDQDWLATGRGPMRRVEINLPAGSNWAETLDPAARTPDEQRLLAAHRLSGPEGRGALDDLATQLLRRANGGDLGNRNQG